MVNRKSIRTRGKLQLSRYFQNLKQGDLVSVAEERSEKIDFPKRLQGRTGIIVGKRGRANIVKIKDQAKEKEFIIKSIHLKKIKPMNKKK